MLGIRIREIPVHLSTIITLVVSMRDAFHDERASFVLAMRSRRRQTMILVILVVIIIVIIHSR